MNRNLIPLFFCLVTLLQGCVGPGPIKKDYSIKNKKIAVVSELGNNFHHVIVGTTVFTNNITKANVKDWKINHLVASHAIERLNKNGIQATELESDFFTSLDESSPHSISALEDKVIEKIKPLGYDNLLLIRATTSENYPFFRPGYGLNTRYFFGKANTCVYTIFIAELYDFKLEKTIGWQWMNAMHGPCLPQSSNDLQVKNSFEEYNDQEKLELRKRLEARIIESLDASLDSMEIYH